MKVFYIEMINFRICIKKKLAKIYIELWKFLFWIYETEETNFSHNNKEIVKIYDFDSDGVNIS